MFSEDIRPNHWNQIIDASERAFADGCVGVVVTRNRYTPHHARCRLRMVWKGRQSTGRIAFVGRNAPATELPRMLHRI